ncbi:hypothetical protein HZC35_03350 [Candidatus Saganbacteria bacterium]|nr:hypothetical protein [Candidatus Saganbacteria bacterium]
MQNRGLKIAVLAWLICFSASQGEVLDPSRVGMGARTLGLGRAQAALSDLSSAFINPANAAQLDRLSISSMYTNLNEDVAYNMIGLGFPIGDGKSGSVAFSYLGAGVSGVQVTSRDADSRTIATSSSNYSSKLAVISYGKKVFPQASFGAALKLYLRSFDSVSGGDAQGFDLDVGALFYPRDNLKVGVALQNILPIEAANLKWGTGLKEDLPINIRAGINYSPRQDLTLVGDYDVLSGIHAGAEWQLHKFFCLRGGVDMVPTGKNSSATNFSAGAGLKYQGIAFDYAYYYDSTINSISSHFFSLGFEMAPKAAPPIKIEPVKIITPEVSAPPVPMIVKPLLPVIKKKTVPPKKPPVKPKKKKIAAIRKYSRHR